MFVYLDHFFSEEDSPGGNIAVYAVRGNDSLHVMILGNLYKSAIDDA